MDFEKQVNRYFGKRSGEINNCLILSEENPDANPLFLQAGNFILISQAFSEIFCYALHGLLDRTIFDQETERRSKIFESKIVKEEFEKSGYRYIPNFKVRNKMEIDGIAISDSKAYVIEIKGWKSKFLIEEKSSLDNLERDVRDAIDGLHITHSTGKIKKRVSLPNKVDWVKNNKSKFNIQNNVEIVGMLVINQEPTIHNYKNCIIKYLDDFEFN